MRSAVVSRSTSNIWLTLCPTLEITSRPNICRERQASKTKKSMPITTIFGTPSEHDEVAVATLSLLAIRQDFTTVDDLKALLDILEIHPSRMAVEASLKKIAHVLRVSDAHGYAIRHESFRLYVEGKTSTNIARLNEALHRWYADHPETNEAWRHRFRHLYELGFYRELLAASNDEWLRKGWAQYRPFAEVNDNIDIAWRAAAELRDLTEFVRIGLMRQRVSLVKDNLGREEPEIAVTLLRLGHPKEALLRVWDGERAIAGQVSFASFCLNHRALLGRPPSLDVMRQRPWRETTEWRCLGRLRDVLPRMYLHGQIQSRF